MLDEHKRKDGGLEEAELKGPAPSPLSTEVGYHILSTFV